MPEDRLLEEIVSLRQNRSALDIAREAGIENKTASDCRASHLLNMYLLGKKRKELVEAGDQGDKEKYEADLAHVDELIAFEERRYSENPLARDFSLYLKIIGSPSEFVFNKARNNLFGKSSWEQRFYGFEQELRKVKYPTLGEGEIRHLEGIYFAARASIANGELRDYIAEDPEKLRVIDSALSCLKSYIDVSRETLRLHERDNGPFKTPR
ncbi:hypothetical protein KY343_00990 [Candidatus Woesearchaeota archaeon]|nr:hypothetical protein [Candidatus Woesearchaeota archaeon]